jgi:hypothetical protein
MVRLTAAGLALATVTAQAQTRPQYGGTLRPVKRPDPATLIPDYSLIPLEIH